MFTIESVGILRRKQRLVAPSQLAEAEFRKVADQVGRKAIKARKLGLVAARKAVMAEAIETRWEGKETTNTARQGDLIVTNLSPERKVLRDNKGNENTYVVESDTFPSLYESVGGQNEFGQIFKAKNTVDAIYLSGGFDILAPWGEKQTAREGYLLWNGRDVYGNNAETFDATYEVIH
jgi:hypothetical protein